MPRKLCLLFFVCLAMPLHAQWTFSDKFEVRANYRNSNHERVVTRFQVAPGVNAVEETPDPGSHVELSVANVQLDAAYGTWLLARVKVHGQDKDRRNPTSSDRKIDADELFIRIGQKPEFLERPAGTSFFAQLGKAPHLERQPTRLLESYGLVATAFNRFEDVQLQVGGTIGRNLYWRGIAANGNPLFFRDPNALAGDNGTPELRGPDPHSKLGSGFPILYNAEAESLFFDTKHVQYGEALGYRWQNDAQTFGYDAIAFHYRRSLAVGDNAENLTGTFYGGDIDLLDGTGGHSLPIHGTRKEEYGARVYSEWRKFTAIAQYTKQNAAGLQRAGYELETGYRFDTPMGLLQWVQPAARISGMKNWFRAKADKQYPAPSVWWPWTKIDYGVRVGFSHNVDVTVERAKHNIGAPRKLDLSETLVTLRVRV